MVKYNARKVKRLIILWLEDAMYHLGNVVTETMDHYRQLKNAKEEIEDCIALLKGKEIIRTPFELISRPTLKENDQKRKNKKTKKVEEASYFQKFH